MTHQRDIEHILDVWFSDGPTEAPDRAFDVVADRIERQPQRPAWRLHLRETHVHRYLKPLLAVAAVLVVAVIGYRLLPVGGVGGTSTSSPSPSASPSTSFACDTGTTGCLGPLEPGEYTTGAFRPTMTYVVADGWTNVRDRARVYGLQRPGGDFVFQVLSQNAIPEQNSVCSAVPKAGAGNSVSDWVDFLTKHPGLDASTPTPVTIDGHAGFSLVLTVAPTWKQTCPNALGPAVMLITDSGATPDRTIWIDNQVETLTILDIAGTTVIIRLESGSEPAAQPRDLAKVQPVIDSMRFTP